MRRQCGCMGWMCRCHTLRIWRNSRCHSRIGWWTRSRKSSERGALTMATNILMPALSPTMAEGPLAPWLKKEGDEIKAGDVIAEIETDKATMEVEAVDEGVLGKILVPDGTAGVGVNATIAILVEAGEAVPNGAAPAAPADVPAPSVAATLAPAPIAPKLAAPEPKGPEPKPLASGERVFASPLAKRM